MPFESFSSPAPPAVSALRLSAFARDSAMPSAASIESGVPPRAAARESAVRCICSRCNLRAAMSSEVGLPKAERMASQPVRAATESIARANVLAKFIFCEISHY